MLKIWGRTNSINVQKVLWCCAEADIDYERVDAGREFGVVDEPWYRELNPNGRVPTIDDDGFVLWESNAIVGYLASRHARKSLYPADLRERALARQWMTWEQTTIEADMRPVFWGLVRIPPDERDWEGIERGIEKSSGNWRVLEDYLAGRTYVVGDKFTMADIPLGVAAYRWFALDVERVAMPNLEAWYERLTERASYREHVMLPLT